MPANNAKFELHAEGSYILVRPDMPVQADVTLKEAVTEENVGAAMGGTVPVMHGVVREIGPGVRPALREGVRSGMTVFFKEESVEGWFFDKDLNGPDKRLAVVHEGSIMLTKRPVAKLGDPSMAGGRLSPKGQY